jgi:NTP pyrophosphatase (non-canonical NTP hydrolase)
MSKPPFRPAISQFALWMEAKLRENDHKNGTLDDSPAALLRRLGEEVMELAEVVHSDRDGDPRIDEEIERGIAREAADVANFAMMIARQAAPRAFSAPALSELL